MSKRAIITGITGQDGSYLAELLLSKGYEVVGTVRRSSAPNFWRIQHLLPRLTIKPADLLDQLSIIRLVDEVRPHELYNLAAMSFVPAAWHRVRHAESDRRRRTDQAGTRRQPVARQSRRAPRLGLRGRLRARDVVDAAAGSPGGLHHRHRHQPRGSRPCQDRVWARRAR